MNNRLIKPLSKNFELKIFHYLQYYYFNKYLKGIEYIYEFGCGTGHNLIAFAKIYPSKRFIGSDFVQSSIDLVAN